MILNFPSKIMWILWYNRCLNSSLAIELNVFLSQCYKKIWTFSLWVKLNQYEYVVFYGLGPVPGCHKSICNVEKKCALLPFLTWTTPFLLVKESTSKALPVLDQCLTPFWFPRLVREWLKQEKEHLNIIMKIGLTSWTPPPKGLRARQRSPIHIWEQLIHTYTGLFIYQLPFYCF